jgi:4-hydroxy-tetrahydrodipicolinate synthase
MEKFTGLYPPVVTPFSNGSIDREGIASIVDHCAVHLPGLCVAGSTGEAPSLTFAERREAIETYAQAMRGRMRLMVGVAETALGSIRELMALGDSVGAEGYLVPLSYYFHHNSDTVHAFYKEVSSFTKADVLIYDNPYTTKTFLAVDDVARVAKACPNVRHVKITDLSLPKVEEYRAKTELVLLAGSDDVMHHQVMRGCVGAVTATPQVYPRHASTWLEETLKGNATEAYQLYAAMLPYIMEMMGGVDEYPNVVKMALRHLGVIKDDGVRLPLLPLSERRRAEVQLVLDGCDLS